MVNGAAIPLRKKLLPHAAFFLILLLLGLTYYTDTIGLLPVGSHDWAQGDRLALAINFYDGGMNFFLPATQNQMSVDGIVGVELPLQSYLAALLAKLFGRGSIAVCFRVVDIAISWAGLYALFRAVFDRYPYFLAAIIAPLLIYFAPVFVIYSGNFLPDPAAVSLCFIGFYFFLRYADSGNVRPFITSTVFLTVAVLMKASTLGYIATLLCVAFYREAFQQKSSRGIIAVIVCGIVAAGLFVAQYYRITWLNEHYQAWLFTARTHPFRTMDEVEGFFGTAFKETWLGEYFLLAEYPVMMFVIVFGLSSSSENRSPIRAWHPLPFFLAGALFMLYLFGRQLTIHDYYMLPIFYPLIGYALVVAVVRIGRRYPRAWPKPVRLGSIATILLLYCLADHQIYVRMHNMGRYVGTYSYEWVQGGDKILDDLRIPKDSRIVVGGDAPPNLSLVYFDRKGFVIPPEQWDPKLEAGTRILREKGLKYLVIPEKGLDTLDQDVLSARYRILFRGDRKAVLELQP